MSKKSKKGLFIGLGAGGCLLLVCCGAIGGGAFYFYYMQPQAELEQRLQEERKAADAAAVEADPFGQVPYGNIKLDKDPTQVLISNSDGAEVAETRAQGEKIEYYGLDPSNDFFKVKTTAGGEGYIRVGDAEIMASQQGQVRIIEASTMVYASNSTTGGVLEVRKEGELLPWYGYDASGDYYKVQTASGADAYVPVTEATIIPF